MLLEVMILEVMLLEVMLLEVMILEVMLLEVMILEVMLLPWESSHLLLNGPSSGPQETRYVFIPDHDRDYLMVKAVATHTPVAQGRDKSKT